MRIISGKYKGRSLEGFDINGTRPTMDRVKESFFAMINLKLKDSVCLDLFAGSGSLGFEALSEGARSCYFVDSNPKIIEILKKNSKKLGITEEHSFYKMDSKKALSYFKSMSITFDLIFLDPPYDKNLIGPTLEEIIKLDLLNDGGLIVCEYEKENFGCELEVIKEKRYGDKNIRIYKKN